MFCKDFKTVIFIKIGPYPSTRKLFLLYFAEHGSWAEFALQGGLADQRIKKGIFVKVEKLIL